jgi:pyridoxamine 5'-phosphate oxidase
MRINLSEIRREYRKRKITVRAVDKNPYRQFELWLGEAIAVEDEPTAMILGTCGADGKPSTRTVLLKGVEDDKLVFYTNYNSRKGRQISENPQVSLTFFWPKLERQVHFEGQIEKAPAAVSAAYFKTRPRKSRIGAWISPQSSVIENRNVIKKAFVDFATRHIGKPVACPPHWGGYYVLPEKIEFWQGRLSRLHDRIQYKKKADVEGWIIERLAP